MTTTTIYGIDFSGSATPGNKIWITEAHLTDAEALSIESTRSIRDRCGVTDRDTALRELRTLIRTSPQAVFGLDFPFGFPRGAVDTDEWYQFLAVFVEEFEDESIDSFPGAFGDTEESKRDVDYRYAGQPPTSPQIQYQVFYGLCDLLWPLVSNGDATVLPMGSREGDTPILIEVYPAATFGRLGLYRTGYKGQSEEANRRRNENVCELAQCDLVSIPETAIADAIESDDALDSICAAFTTWRAVNEDLERDPQYPVEGYIYA